MLGVGLLLKTEEIFVVSGTKRNDERQEIVRYWSSKNEKSEINRIFSRLVSRKKVTFVCETSCSHQSEETNSRVGSETKETKESQGTRKRYRCSQGDARNKKKNIWQRRHELLEKRQEINKERDGHGDSEDEERIWNGRKKTYNKLEEGWKNRVEKGKPTKRKDTQIEEKYELKSEKNIERKEKDRRQERGRNP